MKTFFYLIIISFFIISCDKNDIEISPDAKVKTKYIYSSSTSPEPYAKTSYTYDYNWNIIKELNSDYPKPPTSSYTYQYDSQGRLINKKYNGKTGLNHSNQTEADFSVIREYKYQYIDDMQIELIYKDGELRDSASYKRVNDLVLEEHHYDLEDGQVWGISYKYDSDGKLTKKWETPDDLITIFEYEDSKLIRTISVNRFGQLQSEANYNYSLSGNNEIRECSYGEFLSERITYENGRMIEFIKYHPTFIGSEWWCYRYEYY